MELPVVPRCTPSGSAARTQRQRSVARLVRHCRLRHRFAEFAESRLHMWCIFLKVAPLIAGVPLLCGINHRERVPQQRGCCLPAIVSRVLHCAQHGCHLQWPRGNLCLLCSACSLCEALCVFRNRARRSTSCLPWRNSPPAVSSLVDSSPPLWWQVQIRTQSSWGCV